MKFIWSLFYRELQEGEVAPLFFIPINRLNYKRASEWCNVLIAPLVIILFLSFNILWSVVTDICRLNELIKEKKA